jgi:hypothetical protein
MLAGSLLKIRLLRFCSKILNNLSARDIIFNLTKGTNFFIFLANVFLGCCGHFSSPWVMVSTIWELLKSSTEVLLLFIFYQEKLAQDELAVL